MDNLLLVDTWESGGEIDETILLANGISGMIVRLNDISGGHHMDENFLVQWMQAKVLPVRIVYWVYNPWKNGQENYNWLIAHMPNEAGAVMVDVEVQYIGYSPTTYAAEFAKFYALVKAKYNVMIYTGEWFLDFLAYWPHDTAYWWASYPLAFYNYESLTWGALKIRLSGFDKPGNLDEVPGTLGMWQFTGDRIILPGCNKRMDVNVFYGSLDELKTFANEKPTSDLPLADVLLSGIEYFDGLIERRYETSTPHGKVIYNVTEIESAKAEFFVSPMPMDRDWIVEFISKYDMDAAINCGGWTTPPLVPTGRHASKSTIYGPANTEETIYISKDNVFSRTRPDNVWNAFSYQNRLVVDGQVVPIDKSVGDIRARSAFGYTKDQSKVFFVTVDGKEELWKHEGLNFPEVAEILVKLGCDFGCMFDSGASTSKGILVNDKPTVIGVPDGADIVVGYEHVRLERVLNALCVKMRTGAVVIPPEGETMNWIVDFATDLRPTDSMYNTGTRRISKGIQFFSETTSVHYNLLKPADFGVIFVKYQDGWIPKSYKGVAYLRELETIPDPQPVTGAPKKVVVENSDGSTYEATTFIKTK